MTAAALAATGLEKSVLHPTPQKLFQDKYFINSIR